MRKTFITVAMGKHVDRILFLKKAFDKYCKNSELIVLSDPEENNAVFNSRDLKTSFHKKIFGLKGLCCFIDTDVIPVSENFENIFEEYVAPITFRQDAGKTIKSFGKYACKNKSSLKENIKKEFNIEVDENWKIWNGGCFVLDMENNNSLKFMDLWNNILINNWNNEVWKERDQGFLISASWLFGINNNDYFSKEYCWLHKLDKGLKFNEERNLFYNKQNNEEIKSIHFCLTYNNMKSDTWNKTSELIK